MKKEVFVIVLGSALLLTLAMTSVSAIGGLPLDSIAQKAINGEEYVVAGQGLDVRSYVEVAGGEKGIDAFSFSDVSAIGLDNETIQDRINNASQGDTINISAGTYNENVTVNKTVTLIGTDVEVIGLNPFNVTESDVKISDFVITGTDYENSIGILTATNTTIDNCTVTNSKYAIKFGANNCTVKNSVLTDNLYGIYASRKTNQEIYGNQILNSYQGICLMTGNGTKIYDNEIKNSTAPSGTYKPTGIYLSDTGDLIYNNSFIDNDRQAFVYENRSNTWNTSTIGNLWSDYNGTGYYVIDENNTDYLPRGLERASIQDRINNASHGDTITISAGTYNENVTINKTVTLIGTDVEVIGLNPFNVTEADVKISDFVITGTDYENSIGILTATNTTIDNCTVTNSKYAIKFGANNCTVKNSVLTDNLYGIYASRKTNQEIYGNQILNSYQGICLMTGNGTKIYDNEIKNSTAPSGTYKPTGIYLSDTGDLIYNNSFIDNDRQAFVYENRSNTWNTSTIGNLWSDYNGTGYYVIDENNTDYLPRSLSSVGFDTGEGTYPSLSGTHNGTITPTQTIEVNWMYTYPCEGTGGHSEYVAFFNVTTGDEIANGTWNGYDSGNYSYITFDVPFELTGGVTYNYEIRTGSYPQILHQKYLQNSMGNITCSEFTDVNGVEYDNWIPAIRLGQN
ncbi:CASH domain-dontaining protein [Candidatus Methanophagaceae archaeon]|nr:CASH domain-dontaining protein [Methanophagales archaeon]